MNDILKIIERLESSRSLSIEEYEFLLDNRSPEAAVILREKADKAKKGIYSNAIFIRGLIEISNICKNDCYYCGIRKSNKSCERYRLSKDEILSCCDNGYKLGFRTFVMQGGEDAYFSDDFLF